MNKRIIIVDDEEPIRKLLKSRLEREGFEVSTASSADEAEKVFDRSGPFAVLVTDLKMPGKDGFSLIEWAKGHNSGLKIIMVTGFGEKEVAVRALRQGASDYLEKPFDLDEFTHTVKRCQKEHQLESQNKDLMGRLEARVERLENADDSKTWYESKSSSMTKPNEWLSVLKREAARGDAEEPTVLVLGESGTGKEVIAHRIHSESRRSKGAWIAVNCANFNEQLLESELFGHEKGAFTGATAQKRGLFELANEGTLFLDEIGEIDSKLQAKLLRVLQEKTFRRVGGTSDISVDVRVIAATNQNLNQRVESGQFRSDLYHRLCRIVIELPALRNRREDILPMARMFAQRAFQSRGKPFSGFTPEAEEAMTIYTWPGNVREMINVIERAALVAEGDARVSPAALSLPNAPLRFTPPKAKLDVLDGGGPDDGGTPGTGSSEVLPGAVSAENYTELKKRWVESFEREYLISLLKRHTGNVSQAAREAKLDRSNFLRLLRKHQIKAQEFRASRQAA